MKFVSNDIDLILKDIYNVTGLRVAVFDEKFNEVSAYPTRLCSLCKYVRTVDEINSLCKSCDLDHFTACKNSKLLVKYKCHLGLTEVIVPIFKTDIVVGYIMIGQTIVEDKSSDIKIENELEKYPLDIKKALELYKDIQILDVLTFNSIINIISVYSYHIEKLGKVKKDKLEEEIDRYIFENINQKLEVLDLCRHFNYGKTSFHKKTKEIYGISIAKYIRKVKINYAKELLLTSNFSVAQVAEKVGIYDYNYFLKVFKEEAKSTPKEFIKNNFLAT